ncbi:hypothetical protein BN14_08212 [Rhizoctonia solani AG-1 IB]|uniref:Endonuclease/exonuclease/phosphatase domain-containing protein n=1 Tax=Thanatephorus cucumeris (strain AG1-IB / isolate 7/3/14) TaxID=1108050 RepID=M5C513_THACB|nr:hypothetical protein BN14_08212 [Rhizoctonia solani AG-1 IB]
MHALLNEPIYANIDLFILQDPWWGRIGSQKDINPNNHNIYGTVNSANFLCIIPPGFDDKTGPGVAIYIRNNTHIGAQFSDIAPIHRDFIAIDINIHNSKLTLINCYPHGADLKKTVNDITQIVIPQDRPCIMTGDFNLHHPDWALIGSKWEKRHPNQTERIFATYAEYHNLHLMNDTLLPTHYVPRSPASNAIIDLTLLTSARWVLLWKG